MVTFCGLDLGQKKIDLIQALIDLLQSDRAGESSGIVKFVHHLVSKYSIFPKGEESTYGNQ